MTFTGEPFILRFKSPVLSYRREIKHTPTVLISFLLCVRVRAFAMKDWIKQQRADKNLMTLYWSKSIAVQRTVNSVCATHHSRSYWSCGWLRGRCWRRRLLRPSHCIVSPQWHLPHQPAGSKACLLLNWMLIINVNKSVFKIKKMISQRW